MKSFTNIFFRILSPLLSRIYFAPLRLCLNYLKNFAPLRLCVNHPQNSASLRLCVNNLKTFATPRLRVNYLSCPLSLSLPFLALLLITSCQPQATPPSPPNILFIMSDDHTSQAWGIYGSVLDSLAHNDQIRRLAREGCVLENTFCTNSICVPSRATILTGQYSHLNGVYTLSEPLDTARNNVAKMIQNQGYQTAIIGKWHLRTRPAGFDYYNVLPGQGRYFDPILRDAQNWDKGGKSYEGFSSDVIASQSLDWLRERNTEEPFFLMCHFKATHEPFAWPERYADLYKDVVFPKPETLFDFEADSFGRTFSGQVLEILGDRYTSDKNGRYMESAGFTTEDLDQEEAREKIYQKFIGDFLRSGAAINDNIGRILDYLDEVGLSENTIVIYTADQGYFLGEHGFFDKRMMYEESLRMPFVIRYPKEIPAGSRMDQMILNTDFAPTFLDYAGSTASPEMQGQSFRGLLKGNSNEEWRNQMYYRYWLHQRQRPAHFGIRNEQYKLIFYYGLPLDMPGTHPETTQPAWEFFDLEKDPKERYSRYDDPEYADIIAEMKKELLRLKEEAGDKDEKYPEVRDIIDKYWEM